MNDAPAARRPSRLPAILGWIAGLAMLLFLGPIGLAVALLRSGPEAAGADPAAKIFIALLVLVASALTGLAAYVLARLASRLFRRAS
jgi:hypothetical protein